MYLGSVKFYKHLIYIVFICAIIVMLLGSFRLGVQAAKLIDLDANTAL